MNDAEVSKQVQQMVQFIKQEAEEKANEISVAAEEEFNIEKLQLVEAEKRKIRQEYERKDKQVEVAKKIDYSKQLNASRLKVLQAQDEIVISLKGACEKELAKLGTRQGPYKKLLEKLIVQAALRLQEDSVRLRCRQSDLHLVNAVSDSAAEMFTASTKKSVEILVDQKSFLPDSSSGGIVMASKDGKVVCSNTLDARLEIAFKQNLPLVRTSLFKTAIVT